jgi:putative transcriptional regulator
MRKDDDPHYLTGNLLVAMPQMQDPRFARTVIYMCVHSQEGAMGLVLNRLARSLSFPDLLEQLDIGLAPGADEIRVHFGGPVESARGFVLHSADYLHDGTVMVGENIALTATVDILKAIARGAGPRRSLLALGYAGWAPGQLDGELQRNAWLHVPADEALIFDDDLDNKWERATAKIGIELSHLSSQAGHA